MTTRTIRTLGRGYGSEPAEISVQLDGITVYEGTVPTYDQWPTDYGAEDEDILFDFEIPMDQHGVFPMRYQVHTGRVYFGGINSNYHWRSNPVYSTDQLAVIIDLSLTLEQRMSEVALVAVPPLTPEEYALLISEQADQQNARKELLRTRDLEPWVPGGASWFNCTSFVTDPRSNVKLDGQALERLPEPPGTWGWLVNQAQTLDFDVNIDLPVSD